ncbi:coiled-coil domain-containing protein, partial [Streptomyces sp. 12297]
MSRRLLRTACVAAATAAALVTAVPLPAAADPADPPETAAGTDTAPDDTHASTGAGAAGEQDIGALLTRLQGLYQRAEEAAEAYNGTAAALKARAADERRLGGALGKARNVLGIERAQAGRLAREQYQGAGGFSPYARMLLSGDPGQAFDQGRLAGREARHRAAVLARLAGAEKQADALATEARKALDSQQLLVTRQKKQRDEVVRQLGEVQKLLATLTAEQLSRLAARERADDAEAQRALEASGRLG